MCPLQLGIWYSAEYHGHWPITASGCQQYIDNRMPLICCSSCNVKNIERLVVFNLLVFGKSPSHSFSPNYPWEQDSRKLVSGLIRLVLIMCTSSAKYYWRCIIPSLIRQSSYCHPGAFITLPPFYTRTRVSMWLNEQTTYFLVSSNGALCKVLLGQVKAVDLLWWIGLSIVLKTLISGQVQEHISSPHIQKCCFKFTSAIQSSLTCNKIWHRCAFASCAHLGAASKAGN